MDIATENYMVYCRIKELMAQKERKEKRGITYQIIYDETGISPATVARLSSWDGIKKIDANTIEALCIFFDCEVGDLLVCDKKGFIRIDDANAVDINRTKEGIRKVFKKADQHVYQKPETDSSSEEVVF